MNETIIDTETELDTELDINFEHLESSTLHAEALEMDELEKIAVAISEQVRLDQEDTISTFTGNDVSLEDQIKEDQNLESEIAAELAITAAINAEEKSGVEIKMDIEELQSCIEALLFISDKPLSQDKIRNLLGHEYDAEFFSNALNELQARYQKTYHGMELIEVAGGYQFRTKLARAPLSQKLVKTQTQRLSSGSMETLAITAYKQPIMKEEIDKIRGVDSSYFVRGLLDRKLIKISGRSELPGRPMLYTTTSEFLEIFGLKDLSSLPSLRELEDMIPSSQSGHGEDDDPKTKEMRRLVSEMKSDRTSALHYNPREDEQILKEIKDRVSSILISTPYLDQLKAAEQLAAQQEVAAISPE